MSLSKILVGGLGIAALGAGIYLLSRDSDAFKIDPKVHTLTKLHEILEDIYLEYACGYVFYYSLLIDAKSKSQLTSEQVDKLKQTAEQYTSSRDQIVCKNHGISHQILGDYIKQYSGDSKVKQVQTAIQDLYDQVFVKQAVSEMKYNDLPENLTEDAYLQFIRKLLACVRHEAYGQIQKLLRDPSNKRDRLTDQETEELLQKIAETCQESFRTKILNMNGIEVPVGMPPKRIMQKAYLTHAIKGGITNKKWLDQISHEHKVHADIIDKLSKGEKVEGIEEDPLTSNVEDYDQSVVPGTLLKETGIDGSEIVTLQPSTKGIDHAEALLQKHKTKRAGLDVEQEQVASQVVVEEEKKEVEEIKVEEEEVKQATQPSEDITSINNIVDNDANAHVASTTQVEEEKQEQNKAEEQIQSTQPNQDLVNVQIVDPVEVKVEAQPTEVKTDVHDEQQLTE